MPPFAATTRPVSRWGIPILAAACALALYVPWRSVQFDPNGISEARAVEAGGARIIHPNHLLYRPVGFATLSVLRTLGFDGRALGPLQVMTAICGALTVGLALRTYLAAGASVWAAALAAGWFATSWAQWAFSTDVSYIALAALCAASAVAGLQTFSGSAVAAVKIGVAFALAVLGWQANVCLAPALVIRIWSGGQGRHAYGAVAAFAASAAAIIGVGYLTGAAATGHLRGPAGLVGWTLSYAGGGPSLPIWGVWEPGRLLIAGQSWLMSVVPLWQGLGLRRALHGEWYADKLLGQLALVALLALLVSSAYRFAASDRKQRRAALWMVAAFVLYLPFIVWWDPFAPKWFVVPNLLLAGAAAVVWSPVGRPAGRAALAAAAVLIATANFAYTIWPRHTTPNPWLARAECISAHMQPADLLVVADWDWIDYARYFFDYDGETLSLVGAGRRDEKLIDLRRAIAAAQRRGGRAYMIDPRAYDGARAEWLVVQTGLSVADFARLNLAPAFACDGIAVAELRGETRADATDLR